MSDEDYDLEVLIEIRENEKQEAQKRYADEMEELERRKGYVDSLREDLEELRSERRMWEEEFESRRTDEGFGPREATQYENYLRGLSSDEEGLLDEIERAESAVRDQRERVDRAQDALDEAIKQLEAVERHREDWEEEQERLERRREARQMDEIAARIWREENS